MKKLTLFIAGIILLLAGIVYAWTSGPPYCEITEILPCSSSKITWNQLSTVEGVCYSDRPMDYYTIRYRYTNRTSSWTDLGTIQDTSVSTAATLYTLTAAQKLYMGENIQFQCYAVDDNSDTWTDTSISYQVGSQITGVITGGM